MSPDEINTSSEDIKSGKGTNVGFQAKLQKLKLAKKTALSKNKKKSVLSRAEDLQSNVDNRIKSIALNKFAVRKAKRLKALGKTKEEINSLIIDLETSQESILSRARSGLRGFGIDQKFLGLSADEVLEKINAEVPVSAKTSSTSSLEDIPAESEETEKESSNETPTVINNVSVTNNVTKEVIQDPDGSSGPGGNGVYNEATPDFSASEPLKVRTNPDTDTKQDVEQNNEKIYDYLVKSGELDIANYVLDLMTKPDNQGKSKISDIKANTKELSRLSDTNEEIYGKLEELEEQLVNEQNTSIDVRKNLQKKAEIEQYPEVQEKEEEKGAGFFETILRMILGDTIVDLLKNAGSVFVLAKTLLSKAWKWLSTKITGLVGPMLNSVKKWAKGKLGALGKKISGLGKALVSQISKISSKVAGTAGAAWAATKKKLGLGKADDGVKGAKKSKTPRSRSAKPGKTSKMTKQIKNSKMGKAGKKASRLTKSAVSKVKPKGILKKLLRFTKPIPFLGTAIAAGTAIYSAQDGYRNADEILGKDPKKLTTLDKLASAAGSLVNDVSFGLLDTQGTAEKIIKWMGDDAVDKAVEKYESKGIIDHDVIGNSEVKDWTSLGALPSEEIKKLIDFDDWSDSDLERMQELYQKRREFETKTPDWKDNPVTPEKQVESEVVSVGSPEKVEYTMKSVPKNVEVPMVPGGRQGEIPSKNPSDYKISDLFSKYQVKDQDIENLHPAVLHNLKAMAAEYLDEFGEKIQINSAFRSFEEQADLKEKYGDKAASPGSSMHNYGVAIDMNTDNAKKAISGGLFKKYGFHRPVSGETWHVEPDKIDRAAIRETGMASNPEAADTANIPTPEAPKVETEGKKPETQKTAKESPKDIGGITQSSGESGDSGTSPKSPEKVENDSPGLPVPAGTPSPEQVELMQSFSDIQRRIKVFEERKDRALGFGNRRHVEIINSRLNSYKTQAQEIEDRYKKTLSSDDVEEIAQSEVEEAMKGPAQDIDLEIPDKSESEVPMTAVEDGAKERVEIQERIETLQNTIQSIKAKKDRAKESGNTKAVETTEKWIRSYEKKIMELKAKGSESGAKLSREDAAKDRQMQASENSYRTGLENTKAYDKKVNSVMSAQSGINNVNAIQAPGNQTKYKPSEMFTH